jgi:hypothetical protein
MSLSKNTYWHNHIGCNHPRLRLLGLPITKLLVNRFLKGGTATNYHQKAKKVITNDGF